MQSVIVFFTNGGLVMYPLILCSLIVWAVIFERLWRYRRLGRDLQSFHLQAINHLLKSDLTALRALNGSYPSLPTSKLLGVALDSLNSNNAKTREKWAEAVERRRLLINQELRKNFWLLGTIGSSAPFIGLFGTVVGIMQSFRDIARTGKGGFAIVASGISEALIATAAGIVVAVIALIAYNAFQTKCSFFVLLVKIQIDELLEYLGVDQA